MSATYCASSGYLVNSVTTISYLCSVSLQQLRSHLHYVLSGQLASAAIINQFHYYYGQF